MNDAQTIFDDLIEKLPFIRKMMLEDAKTMGTYGKAKKYLRDFKYDFGNSYTATAEEQTRALFNSLIDDVILELNKESDKARINHE